MQPETITTDPDLLRVMEDLYHWLDDWDRFPKAWLKAPAQVGVRAFISALQPIFVKDLEEFTSEDVQSYLAAWRAAPAANAAVMSFRPHNPPFEIPDPPPFPDLLQGTAPAAKSKKGDLTEPPASGGEDSLPATPTSVNEQGNSESTGEELQCTPCHSRFTSGELGSRRSTRACPMCGDPLVAADPDDGRDFRWWTRDNPTFQLPYVRGGDLSEHVGNVVFVEVTSLEVEEDPIRPLQQATVDEIRSSLRVSPLLAPVVVKVGRRLCAGRHRHRAHQLEGRRWIQARIVSDDLRTEYLTLVENVCRAELCALQMGVALRKMKELYEALHPETRHGVAGGKAGGRGRESEQAKDSAPATPSFCTEAAAKVGKSDRAVQTLIQIGVIAPAAQKILMATRARDVQSKLLRVARADGEAAQVALARQYLSDEELPSAKAPTPPSSSLTANLTLREEDGIQVAEGRLGGRMVRVRLEGDKVTIELSRASNEATIVDEAPDGPATG